MAIELILHEYNRDMEDQYQFHKLNTGQDKPLSSRQAAYHLVEFGYSLMKKAWGRSDIDSIMGKAAFRTVNEKIDVSTATQATEEIAELQRDKPAQFLTFFNPVREYNDLITDQKRVPTGFSLKISEYVSLGSFPIIKKSDLLGIVGRQILNTFGYVGKGTINIDLNLGDANRLYSAQEKFLRYEKDIDREMLKKMRQTVKDKTPLSLKEFELCFADAFRIAVDNLGGIQKFQQVRKNLYQAHEKLADSGIYTFPVALTINHFKQISKKKVRLYEAITEVNLGLTK